jgi:hypothetical protein
VGLVGSSLVVGGGCGARLPQPKQQKIFCLTYVTVLLGFSRFDFLDFLHSSSVQFSFRNGSARGLVPRRAAEPEAERQLVLQ